MSTEVVPKLDIYDPKLNGGRVMERWGWFGGFAALSTAGICVLAGLSLTTENCTNLPSSLIGTCEWVVPKLPRIEKWQIALLASCWAVFPPIWFWYEYFFQYRQKAYPG